jgi:hypothetical protein
MDNKKRKTNCLNCKHSYRDKDRVLRCTKGHTTSVTFYDCESYEVFLEDKEDLYKMYQVVENLKTTDSIGFLALQKKNGRKKILKS